MLHISLAQSAQAQVLSTVGTASNMGSATGDGNIFSSHFYKKIKYSDFFLILQNSFLIKGSRFFILL